MADAPLRYLNSGPGAVAGYYIKDGLDDGGRRYVPSMHTYNIG